LFAPGDSVDHFRLAEQIGFEQDLSAYSNANAWWLAEFCRLVYRIDDQLGQAVELSTDIDSALNSAGFRIARILFDPPTSTRAVVFTTAQDLEVEGKPVTLIVFCGTNAALDWRMNIQALQESFVGDSRVHAGFKKCFESLAEEIHCMLPSEGALILAGHSLGAALATLTTVALNQNEVPVQACYSFGSPRVGNKQFIELVTDLPVYRLVNNWDIVTTVPLSLGPSMYLHPDDAMYFSQSGELTVGMSDTEIQERQLSYIPGLKKYAELASFVQRAKALSTELPVYLADHAIVNYRNRIAAQLAIEIDRSP